MTQTVKVGAGQDWTGWAKEQLFRAVNAAFELVSGNPDKAIAAASGFPATAQGIDRWIRGQARQAALGATAYLIPLIHLKAVVPEVLWVFNRMGQCAWGVGHLLGCPIDGKADLEVVLGLWSGAISQDRLHVELRAAYRAGHLVAEGATIHALPSLGAFLASEEGEGGAVTVPDALAKATMAQKIALKVMAKLLPKFVVKAGVGFLSLVGAGVVAALNRKFVREFGVAARIYYRAKLQLQDLVDPASK